MSYPRRTVRPVSAGRAAAVLAAVCLALAPLTAARAAVIVTITFDADPPGPQANGFRSVDSDLVTFTDSVGGFTGDPSDGLVVGDFGDNSDGQGMAVGNDGDDSALILDFASAVVGLSLDFGNDEGGQSSPGDEAVLTVLRSGAEVGEARVALNRNDVMDQTISVTGVGPFDRAVFKFDVDPSTGLTEVVDNLVVRVPEPVSAVALVLLGVVVGCSRVAARVVGGAGGGGAVGQA